MWSCRRHKKRSQRGFTLIELLVVILIVAMTTAIVAPVAYKSVDKFTHRIKKKEVKDIEEEAEYLSFIKDEHCKIKDGYIICGKKVYTSLRDVFK